VKKTDLQSSGTTGGDGQEGSHNLLDARNWRSMARHENEWKARIEGTLVRKRAK
jgi:hypothetical protein